ncbi:hypothetical protein PG999_010011 [Apiospora kogelbergensis]|uniref:Terpene synthase n=1 Tax=Apiospora kogelbergensis TaxID=1337665 RepID=A0AAW0QL14_9PEZI
MRNGLMGSHDYVQTLRGQTLRFPDFDHLLHGWPRSISPYYETLKEIHEEELKQLLGLGTKRLEAAIAAEFSLNAATWLYIWDNETDSPEFNEEVGLSWEAGEKFRAETSGHIKAYLADNSPRDHQKILRAERISSILASFNPVGEAAAFRMTRGQRALFMRQLLRFVDATGDEQRSELSGVAPSIAEYLQTRMGTSGVETISACTELAVLYHEHQDLQVAMDKSYEIVKASVSRLESASARLLERYPDRRADLEAFIAGVKTMCTGNIEWSVRNNRYNLGFTKCDGTAEIVI